MDGSTNGTHSGRSRVAGQVPAEDPLRAPGLSGRCDGEIDMVNSVIGSPLRFRGYDEFGVAWPVPEEAVRRVSLQQMT